MQFLAMREETGRADYHKIGQFDLLVPYYKAKGFGSHRLFTSQHCSSIVDPLCRRASEDAG